jgi:hypothetical protein
MASFLNWRRERESLSGPADIDGGDAETRFVELVPQSAQRQCRELSAATARRLGCRVSFSISQGIAAAR